MSYLTKSARAIGQVVGVLMGAGITRPVDKAHHYVGFTY